MIKENLGSNLDLLESQPQAGKILHAARKVFVTKPLALRLDSSLPSADTIVTNSLLLHSDMLHPVGQNHSGRGRRTNPRKEYYRLAQLLRWYSQSLCAVNPAGISRFGFPHRDAPGAEQCFISRELTKTCRILATAPRTSMFRTLRRHDVDPRSLRTKTNSWDSIRR